jgi:transposase
MKKEKRESHYVIWTRMAYAMTKAMLPTYRHRNSPKTYTQPQLVAAVLLGFYLDLGYRDLEEWLLASEAICAVLELKQVPDHSTLCRAYGALSEVQQRTLNAWFLKQQGMETQVVAIDATGFSPTHASQHYVSRCGRAMKNFRKGFYVVDVERQYILGWREAEGPGGSDGQYLNSLRRQAYPYARKVNGCYVLAVLADKGFDAIQARPTDFIRPRRGRHPIRRPDRRARADLTDMAHLDGFMGRRWVIESVISVMKRKSGQSLRSHRRQRQRREIGMKALVYNLHR